MSDEAGIEDQVEQLLQAPIAEQGFQLLEVQFRQEGRWVLRLIIDGEAGVNLDDCGAVSELAGRVLDVEDVIPQAYALEVSSPGLFRPLKTPKHFRQSIGRTARVNVDPTLFPERKESSLRGVIVAVTEKTDVADEDVQVQIRLKDETVTVPMGRIQSAKLDPDL